MAIPYATNVPAEFCWEVRGPRMGGWICRGWIWHFGAPRFSVQRPQNAYFKTFWDLWTENRCTPKTPNPTTTDPIPHSRPSPEPRWDNSKVSHQRVFALLRGEKPQLEMAKVLRKPVFALPGGRAVNRSV